MKIFGNQCYACQCPEYTESDTCPCECHEAFVKCLRYYGNKEECIEALDRLKESIETDRVMYNRYKMDTLQHIFEQKFKGDNK